MGRGGEKRFGIVNIDFATQKRTIKASGLWYKKFLTGFPVETRDLEQVKNKEGSVSNDIFAA
jgi:hypothetical protein